MARQTLSELCPGGHIHLDEDLLEVILDGVDADE